MASEVKLEVPAKVGRLPLVQYTAHGGDCGAPARACVPPRAGAPVGVVGAQAQVTLRRRILRAFAGRVLLESFETKEMLGYLHSGFPGTRATAVG